MSKQQKGNWGKFLCNFYPNIYIQHSGIASWFTTIHLGFFANLDYKIAVQM